MYTDKLKAGRIILLTGLATLICLADSVSAQTILPEILTLCTRSRVQTGGPDSAFVVVCKAVQWQPAQTAIIICDVWDKHWCKGAAERVTELAPTINEVVSIARGKGVLIIHAPAETIRNYENHPARKLASAAPRAANLPADITNWCNWKDEAEKKAGYPIDHSDGGCDCQTKCKEGSPWTKQNDLIEIRDKDAISNNGVEIWNLLEQRKITNVIVMGVHANMCVLGRPFGLRNMARFGKNVVLMRDLTDTMYNSQMSPHVNHFTGTDLIVEHIEKFVCPTITSACLTGKPAFRFKADNRPRVVFISAENEYKAAETLPEFARELQMKFGLYCEVLQGDQNIRSPDRYKICGMETLAAADLAVIFVRRRAFPAQQMQYLHDYLARGGPLVGLRTASHAFDTRGDTPPGYADWPRFDPEVLGGNYNSHYGDGPTTTVTAAPASINHPVLAGVQLPFTSIGSLYKASPLRDTTTLLLTGAIPDKQPEPVAWTNTYNKSRVFYTSLGHPDDFKNPQFRKILVNAIFWAINKSVPQR